MAKSSFDMSLVKELMHKTQEEINKMPPVNVMLVGKTGVGKSTLVNSIFRENLSQTGIGKPVTQHLVKIAKDGVPISLYDTRGLELEKSIQHQVKKEVLDTIKKNKGKEDQIHVVYYCLNAASNRIEASEIDFIKELGKEVPVIVVLTQSIGTPAEEFRKYIYHLNLGIVGVVNIMAQPYPIYESVTIPSSGLVELIDLTFTVVPKEVSEALTNVQQVDIARKAKQARKWATHYIATTFGIGFSPIPFSDATLLVPMQVTMMAHITAIFGMAVDKNTMTTIVSVVGGTSGATFLGRYITSNLLKLIPGVGSIAGGIISGTTASIITTALGMSYVEVLTILAKSQQEGGTVSMDQLKELMKTKIEQRLKQGKQNPDIQRIRAQQGITKELQNDSPIKAEIIENEKQKTNPIKIGVRQTKKLTQQVQGWLQKSMKLGTKDKKAK